MYSMYYSLEQAASFTVQQLFHYARVERFGELHQTRVQETHQVMLKGRRRYYRIQKF